MSHRTLQQPACLTRMSGKVHWREYLVCTAVQADIERGVKALALTLATLAGSAGDEAGAHTEL